MKRKCHETEIKGQFSVTLYQTGRDSFTVIYGKQIRERLCYSDAATEYGACVMHAAACAGLLDNRERGE